MKKIIIILVLLVLIAGGALGGLAIAGMGPLAMYFAESKPESVAADLSEAPPGLVDLETIAVPIFEGNLVRSRLFLNVQISVDPASGGTVAANMPRLQDAVLSDLLVYMPFHLRDRDKVDLSLVRNRLLKVARKVAGDSAVREVTITSAFER